MRQLIILFSSFILAMAGCSDSDNFNKTSSTDSSSTVGSSSSAPTNSQSIDSIKKAEDMELIKKWTWNDKMTKPLKSSISNPKFSFGLLFKTWAWDDNNQKPALTFKKDSLNIHGEQTYIYTINYDSLRIFTSYDRPGDGFTRGIITKLTKDSLIINWSTDENDMNKYVPIKNK